MLSLPTFPISAHFPAAALHLRGEGTTLNFHPAHYGGVAQQLAGQSFEEVVAALRALSRGGTAARQLSSRFRGVSRHQKVSRASWGSQRVGVHCDTCSGCSRLASGRFRRRPTPRTSLPPRPIQPCPMPLPQGKWEARIGTAGGAGGKRYVYLGLHDSGAAAMVWLGCSLWPPKKTKNTRLPSMLCVDTNHPMRGRHHTKPVPPPCAEVAAAMAYDHAIIREKGADAPTNFHLVEYAEQLGERRVPRACTIRSLSRMPPPLLEAWSHTLSLLRRPLPLTQTPPSCPRLCNAASSPQPT